MGLWCISAWIASLWRSIVETAPPSVPEPLDHPALRSMSPNELADLPIPRHAAPARRPPVRLPSGCG